MTNFYLSKKYTNGFVIDRISFVHTDAINNKGGSSFLWIHPVQFSMVARHDTQPSVLPISYSLFSAGVLETKIHVSSFITEWICQVCKASLTKLLLLT